MKTKAKDLIKIIKYTPLVIIFFTSILLITLLYQEEEKEFQKEKIFIESEYIKNEKNGLYTNLNTVHRYVKNEIKNSEKALKKELTFKINNAHKIATNIYLKNKDTYSKSEIIRQIKNAIETIRFNEGRGYFGIHTMQGINVMHPINPKFENKSLLNLKDSKGNYPVREGIELLKTKDEAFLNWYYYKPNNKSKEFKKVGIVKKFEPYNLIIATAIYMDDYKSKLKIRIIDYISKLQYKNGGYIGIVDFNGNILLHPSEEKIHHNILKEKQFPKRRDLLKNLLSQKEQDSEKFISLDEKTIFAKRLDEWKWVLATSFNMTDANKMIEKKRILLIEKNDFYKKEILFYGLIITLILLIISFFIAKLIENKFFSYQKNIVEQMIEKDKLLHVKEEFNNFFELSINLQLISTLEGKIIQINNASKTMLGYDQEELINKSFIDLLHPEDVQRTKDEMTRLKNGEIVYFFENRYKHKNGNYIHLAWSSSSDKERNLIYASAQNTTNAKLLQKEKQEKENMLYQQSKMAAMGEMLGNIAHQWRQPLSIITTSASGTKLQKEMECLSDKQFYSSMDTINDTAQYLSQTIDDFKGFFNPKDNKFETYNISDILAKTLKLINSQFITKDIKIIQDIQDYQITTIQNELIQVLINILNNARDILISKENKKRLLFINIFQKNNISYIEIIDNAGGVDELIIDRIFEPYFTTKEKLHGTGIGLYMSFDIIQNHLNGHLQVSNESYVHEDISYKGAKFTIRLDSTS
jgi:PAS domain S-box-containing protein